MTPDDVTVLPNGTREHKPGHRVYTSAGPGVTLTFCMVCDWRNPPRREETR